MVYENRSAGYTDNREEKTKVKQDINKTFQEYTHDLFKSSFNNNNNNKKLFFYHKSQLSI